MRGRQEATQMCFIKCHAGIKVNWEKSFQQVLSRDLEENITKGINF